MTRVISQPLRHHTTKSCLSNKIRVLIADSMLSNNTMKMACYVTTVGDLPLQGVVVYAHHHDPCNVTVATMRKKMLEGK